MPSITTMEFYHNYWKEFMEYLHNSGTTLHIPENPLRKPDQSFKIKGGKLILYGMIKIKFKQVTVELYVRDLSKILFKRLEGEKDAIERDIGEKLDWSLLPGQEFSTVALTSDFDPKEESQRDEQFAWLKENLEKFNDVFGSTRY